LIRELMPEDSSGLTSIGKVILLPDGQHYAYDNYLNLSTLYLLNGLK
jgi:hypothetical protein